MSKRIIYILGSAYCGSTVLGKALHERVAKSYFVGEVSRLNDLRERYKLDKYNGECSVCLVKGRKCVYFNSIESTDIKQTYQELFKKTKSNVLIDGSKHVQWLRELVAADLSYEMYVVVSTRNPVDFIDSCVARRVLEPWQAANVWRDTYFDGVRELNKLGLSYKIVRHEDFVTNKIDVIDSIIDNFNLKKRIGTVTLHHSLGSNPAAFVSELSSKKIENLIEKFGSERVDFNPRRYKNVKQNGKELRRVALQTPALNDLAVLLGYTL